MSVEKDKLKTIVIMVLLGIERMIEVEMMFSRGDRYEKHGNFSIQSVHNLLKGVDSSLSPLYVE